MSSSPLSVTRATPRRPQRVLVVLAAVGGWLLASWLLGGLAMLLGLLLLLLAVVLVPVGLVYGVVIRALLLIRQRAAASAAEQGGAPEELPETVLRRSDRWLAIVLLAIAAALGLVWAVETLPVGGGPGADGFASLGTLQSVAGQFGFGLITQALLAVIPAAALATRIATERAALHREAAALRAGAAGAQRLRWTRALSWAAFAVWSGLAIASAGAVVAPSFG